MLCKNITDGLTLSESLFTLESFSSYLFYTNSKTKILMLCKYNFVSQASTTKMFAVSSVLDHWGKKIPQNFFLGGVPKFLLYYLVNPPCNVH